MNSCESKRVNMNPSPYKLIQVTSGEALWAQVSPRESNMIPGDYKFQKQKKQKQQQENKNKNNKTTAVWVSGCLWFVFVCSFPRFQKFSKCNP